MGCLNEAPHFLLSVVCSSLPGVGRVRRSRERVRKSRRWFSKKYYASEMNIRDFFADNLGKEFQCIISDAFKRY